jgi:hypothetical protein
MSEQVVDSVDEITGLEGLGQKVTGLRIQFLEDAPVRRA